MDRSIIDCIREHIREHCPLLKDWEGLFPSVGIDTMEEEAASYMVEKAPADPVLKRYTDGSTVRQEVFTFASREFAEGEAGDIHAFYDAFTQWLPKSVDLLQLPAGCHSRRFQVTTGGYIYNEEGTKAQYQIQCRLEFYDERSKRTWME